MTSKVVAVESSVQGSFLVCAERLRASDVVAFDLPGNGVMKCVVLNALRHLRRLQAKLHPSPIETLPCLTP